MSTMAETLTLRGRLDLALSTEPKNYPLANVHAPAAVRGFQISPTPSDDVLVLDIQVGRSSQLACSGSFKASLLERLPREISFDSVPKGMTITLVLCAATKAQIAGTCEIALDPLAGRRPDRACLMPLNNTSTQVPGRLSDIVTTAALSESLAAGRVRMIAEHAPFAYEHQEIPLDKISYRLTEDGRPELAVQHQIGIGERLLVRFEGQDAERFRPEDVIAVLRQESPGHQGAPSA